MLIWQEGSTLIGFTDEKTCPKCKNKGIKQVRQYHVKVYPLGIPTGTGYRGLFIFCPICEFRQNLFKPGIFTSQSKWEKLHQYLHDGRFENRKHYIKIKDSSEKEAERYLKRLNDLKCHKLVKFLTERMSEEDAKYIINKEINEVIMKIKNEN